MPYVAETQDMNKQLKERELSEFTPSKVGIGKLSEYPRKPTWRSPKYNMKKEVITKRDYDLELED